MTEGAIERKRKLSIRTKLAFASGSLEEAMVLAANVATMIFYNQVLGVSPGLCGTAFMIGGIVDAISDPVVGAISDSVHTRWGRRHPFMFASALPLGVFFYLLYQPPSGLSELQLFAWLVVMFVGLRLAKSFYAVPHIALGAELTDDYDERTSVFGWNFVVYSLAGAVLGYFVLAVIFPTTQGFENGLLNPERYQFLAIFGGIFVFVWVLICTFTTADQIPYLHETLKKNFSSFLKDTRNNIGVLLRNPSYIAVCACWLVLATSGGVLAVVATYTLLYAFELTTEQLAFRAFVTLPGAFVGILLSAWFVRQFDKKYTVILTCFITSLLLGLPYTLRLLGWMPENGTDLLLVVIFGIWIMGYLFLPVVPIVIDSQLVDITDEHELATGERAEGVIFSVRTMCFKMTASLGTALAGFALEFIDFPDNASAETLKPEVIDGLLWMTGPLYIFIVYAGVGFAFLYRIDRKRHAQILRELEIRRARSTEVDLANVDLAGGHGER